MRRVLRQGLPAVDFLQWHEGDGAQNILEFQDTSAAVDFLHAYMDDPVSLMALRELLSEASPSTDITGLEDQDVLAALAGRLVGGQVRVVPSGVSRPAVQAGIAAQAVAAATEAEAETGAPAAPAVPQTAVSWIKFKVVEDTTEQPASGVALRITLPNGGETMRATNAEGLIDIQGIEPGLCNATSVRGNATLDHCLSFVRLTAEQASAAGNQAGGSGQSPIPAGQYCIANIEAHRVRTGESLASLATDVPMTWQDLARFNWGTTAPDEINEHLRDDVGCTRRTADGNNYIFDDADDPGIIHLPRPWSQTGLATEQTHIIRIQAVAVFTLHMHLDADRDGSVDDDRSGLDQWEWGAGRKGAVILVNNDDDDNNHHPDHEDAQVNGTNDALELAPLEFRRGGTPAVAPGCQAELSVDDASKIRIFDSRQSGSQEIIGPTAGDTYTFPNLSPRRFQFGMEATQYAGTGFDGLVRLRLRVTSPTGQTEEQAVVRVAPWIMPNHTDGADRVYVVNAGESNRRFRNELASYVTAAGGTLQQHNSNDVWMQDCMEIGFSNLPTHGISAVFRAPRNRPLQAFPRTLLDPDFGYHEQGDIASDTTFDSHGNLEVTPPVTSSAGKSYPWGRIYYGGAGRPQEPFDADVEEFLIRQVVQEPINIDTSWLAVGHVDEIISMVPGGPKGFKMLLACPRLAYQILDNAASGPGSTTYTIVRNDTLSAIATRYGMTWQALYNYDGGSGTPNSARLRSGDPNLIYPGESILVPGGPRMLIGRSFPEYDVHGNYSRRTPCRNDGTRLSDQRHPCSGTWRG